MRAVFFIWGGFGFLICGFATLSVIVNDPTSIALPITMLMWIGGMVLFGLGAIAQQLEWLPIQIRPPTVDETPRKHREEIAARLHMS